MNKYAKYIVYIIILLIITLFSKSSISSDYSDIEDMKPLKNELLEQPIVLKDCHGLIIIEWRSTPDKKLLTSPNSKSIKIINDICKLVFEKYPSFIKKEGYSFSKNHLEAAAGKSACLMPADIYDHGKDFRNLNDLNYRFKNRSTKYSKYVWGFYSIKLKTMFMENDPIDEFDKPDLYFQTTFAHELYHIISSYTGIYYKVGVSEEEEMAERFTQFIGYNK